MRYTCEEYRVLRERFGIYQSFDTDSESEHKYKEFLKHRIRADDGTSEEDNAASARRWYAILFGSFRKLPLFVGDPDADKRSLVAWRMWVGR